MYPTAHIRRDIRTDCFCSCGLRSSRAEWILFSCLFRFSNLRAHSRRTLAELESCNRQYIRVEPQTAFPVVTCAVLGLSVFCSLVSIWHPGLCAIPDAHLGSTARIAADIRVDCFCSCQLPCCRVECVLLHDFNIQPDIIAV